MSAPVSELPRQLLARAGQAQTRLNGRAGRVWARQPWWARSLAVLGLFAGELEKIVQHHDEVFSPEEIASLDAVNKQILPLKRMIMTN